MKPDEPSNSQSGLPLLQQRSISDTPSQQTSQPSNNAAINVIRSQIDNLFSDQNNTANSTTSQSNNQQLEDINPYERTHTDHVDPQAEQWRQYHSAWQTYYQKYYDGYYSHHYKANRPDQTESSNNNHSQNQALSKDEAVFDLRQKLLGKVSESAKKIKKSRHFIPIISGLIVILIFLFLQYNQFIIGNIVSYISPGSIDPQNIVVNPDTDVAVSSEPRLIIPKINVDVPVWYDIGNDYDSQMAAMAKGVAHFAITGANSHPGQVGNTVIAGHSSNDLLSAGDYKFIFSQLDKLVAGDTIYANYNSKRYTYIVTKKQVVSPTDVNSLVYTTDKPILTLLTCTPVGTATSRLLVIAEQISPDPAKATAASTTKDTTTSTKIPGTSKTIWEQLFGSNG